MDIMFVWLIIGFTFLFIELLSPGLVYAAAFGFGAFGAALTAFISDDIAVHMFSFLCVTLAALVVLRRFVVRSSGSYHATSNVYALVGKKGLLVVAPHGQQFGYVQVGGQVWACRILNQQELPINTEVMIVAVKGAHVVVRPCV